MAYNPQIRDARPPASLHSLDGNAIGAITRQYNDFEAELGQLSPITAANDANTAHVPGHEDIPLHGYEFTMDDGTPIRLGVDVDPNNGQPIGADQELAEHRNRSATFDSRERERGSRSFNYAYNQDRTPNNRRGRLARIAGRIARFGRVAPTTTAPNPDYGYGREEVKAQYRASLSASIAQKLTDHIASNPAHNNASFVREATVKALAQEEARMGALEKMAAEQKTSNRFLNFLRRNSKARLALGLVLSGAAIATAATGMLAIAAPIVAVRAVVSGTGGYLAGNTLWEAFQGKRAQKKPLDDPRSTHPRDIYPTNDETAYNARVKNLGAEARAHRSKPGRQTNITGLTRRAQQHLADNVDFSGGHTYIRIFDQINQLHEDVITPAHNERLASDQQQARARHRAGLVGALAMAAIPGARLFGMTDFGIKPGLLGFGGGNSGHTAVANSIPQTNNAVNHAVQTIPTPQTIHPLNNVPGASGSTIPSAGDVNGAPRVEINIDGGNGNDNIYVGAGAHDAASHSHEATAGHASGDAHHNLHETFDGISTGELDVKAGGGFISTLESQYNLSPAQAEAAYHAMHAHLLNAPGTYLQGSDIRISAPGTFELPSAAQTDLEDYLKGLHRMSELTTNGDHATANMSTGNAVAPSETAVPTDAQTGGSIAPAEFTVPVDPQTGGAIAPDEAALGGTAAPAAPTVTGGTPYSSGLGSNLYIPGTPVDPAHLQALNNIYNVPETSINVLTTDQAKLAKDYLSQLVVVGNGGIDLPPSDKSLAQAVIQKYIENSLDRPVTTPDAQQAIANLKQLWDQMGHNIISINKTQAVSLQQALEAVNNG